MAESTGQSYTLSADGNTDEFTVRGPIRLSLTNDFGSGTAKLQTKVPNQATATWVDVANASYTAAADNIIDFPVGARNVCRVNLASSTSPDLDIIVQQSEWTP